MAHCENCGTTEKLEQHHLTALADGGDVDGETVTLCRFCHQQLHWERGDFERWKREGYRMAVALFGADEVTCRLSRWGRRGYDKLVEKRGPEYMQNFHRKGGRARAGRPRDSKGRYIALGTTNV